ncbi:MAG: sulfatase-like hydrolase/transferase [Armatimonadia bacterium]|nr:sulfatase-like hydrolase/transferase [Armatimonadia bacterium]
MSDRKPNFIVIFMDDMGYGDMGCFGSTSIETPRMDQIAGEGIKFTQMYSAAPICTPSRFGILTGRYPQRAGLPRVLFPQDTDGLPDDETTIAEVLGSAGYATQCVGKWHLGCLPEHNPIRHGFDEYFGLLYSNDMDPLHLYRGEEAIETEVEQATLTRRYTDEVIDFIERNQERPFFAYLAHTMPHIPLHVEEEFRGRSAGGTYGDTIECIDHHLGRIMDKLEELGLVEDTMVVVTSDNGPWFEGSTGGLRGRKFDTYEGGVRMPFVAQWPRAIKPRTVCFEPASLLDLMPTFASLAGGELPRGKTIDGVDISAAFRAEAMPSRDAFYYYCIDSLNAVRVGNWKLHLGAGPDGNAKEMPQLFDIHGDPRESYNIANRYPDTVEELRSRLEAFDAEVKAECGQR